MLTEFRCNGCNDSVSDDEIELYGYEELDGLCGKCYEKSMEAAYDSDDWRYRVEL